MAKEGQGMNLGSRCVYGMALAITVAMAGCRTLPVAASKPETDRPEGSVSYAMLPSYASGQYSLKQGEHAFGAQPLAHEAPTYPPSLIGKGLPPTVVRVKAIVDGSGKVTEVRDLDASSDATHLAFLEACKNAVSAWTFSPMTFVEEVEDAHGTISEKRRTAPFSLDYAFRFELVDGRPSVTANH